MWQYMKRTVSGNDIVKRQRRKQFFYLLYDVFIYSLLL